MPTSPSASSAYFRIPRFTKGDLDEVMRSFRPQEIGELAPNQDVPLFPFPDDRPVDDLPPMDLPGGSARP